VIGILIGGGVSGLGVLLLVGLLVPTRRSPAAALAALDAGRRRTEREHSLVQDRRHQRESMSLRRFGSPLREALESRGIQLPKLRADLGLVGRSVETHLAVTVIAGVSGFVGTILLGTLLALAGASLSGLPLVVALVVAGVAAAFPTLLVRSAADERRRDFRHVVGSFLDLVSMNLAGGRGIPEALDSASGISRGWAMVRLRDTLENARLQGITPWSALGLLGAELDIDELRDLSAALALVAEDGAKVRESLAARAASMRTRELADLEARAQERSQSMLVAQLLLCVGFLLFLTYPALAGVLAS
jgi:tight adherence protein C